MYIVLRHIFPLLQLSFGIFYDPFAVRVGVPNVPTHVRPHQLWSGSALKVRDTPGSIIGRACRSRLSKFSVVFSETRLNRD